MTKSYTSLASSLPMSQERTRFEKMAVDNDLTHDVHSTEFDVGVLMPIYGRHKAVKLNVDMLCNQSLKPAIILVASYMNDIEFIKSTFKNYNNVFLCVAPNYPLGVKWSDGTKYCKRFELNALVVIGSDDFLSLEYLEYSYQLIGEGEGSAKVGCSDLVGARTFHMYQDEDTLVKDVEGNPIVLENLYKFSMVKDEGTMYDYGRMYSKRLLDNLGWEIFERIWFRDLGYKGFFDTVTCSGKVYEITDEPDIAVLTIKGNWDTMGDFEDFKTNKSITHKKLSNDTADKFFKTYFNYTKQLFRIK